MFWSTMAKSRTSLTSSIMELIHPRQLKMELTNLLPQSNLEAAVIKERLLLILPLRIIDKHLMRAISTYLEATSRQAQANLSPTCRLQPARQCKGRLESPHL